MKLLILPAALLLCALEARAQTVSEVSASQMKKIVASHKGRPVIVNVWATWCAPCVEEMPALARLQKAYAGRMSLLLVSADSKASVASSVKPFLRGHKLARSYLIAGSMSRWGDAFAPSSEAFALPRTFVFDKRGRLVASFSGAKTFAQWQAVVKPLLK